MINKFNGINLMLVLSAIFVWYATADHLPTCFNKLISFFILIQMPTFKFPLRQYSDDNVWFFFNNVKTGLMFAVFLETCLDPVNATNKNVISKFY